MEPNVSPSPEAYPLNHNAPLRFSFQYFDQESDFGIEDENGERIRKRKRPGRKPKPPSLSERRAQNRAAQRAFREREQLRRQEKERESQRHIDELNYLRRRLSEVQYEANYLRGCVLLLSLTSLIERGSVPHIWTDTRLYPIPKADTPPTHSKADIRTIPAILLTVLGNNNHILEFQEALLATRSTGWGVTDQIVQVLNNLDNDKSSSTGAASGTSASTDASSSSSTSNRNINTHLAPLTLLPTYHTSQQQQSHKGDNLFPSTGPESMVSTFTAINPILGTTTDTPTLKTPCDLAHMPALQALHILRLQLKCSSILGEKTRSLFIPTSLQRLIPHDARIDYIPLGSMRDRMILFQGLYDADDCFELLSTKTMFTGGEERDNRNWVIHPSFSEKYWFLSHHLVDYHSGECGLIPDIIEAILSAQQEREEEIETSEQQQLEQEKTEGQQLENVDMILPSITREGGLNL